MKHIKLFEQFINNDSIDNSDQTVISKEITITPNDDDIDDDTTYEVTYSFEMNGELIDMSGTLIPFDSGRSIDYTFEPNWFSDKTSEDYYDNNHENIEEEIMNKFYE